MLEDNPDDVTLIERELRKGGLIFKGERVDTREEFIECMHTFRPDVILSDHGLPQFNSFEALKLCQEEKLEGPFILVTGTVSEEFAISCLLNGADDYILKSNLSRLPVAIRRAIKERKQELLKQQAQQSLKLQHEELQKAHSELDRFVYSISHNLRGPLASVMGLLHVAAGEKDTSELSRLHRMMSLSVTRLDETLKEILAYSHNGRTEIESLPIHWVKIISDAFVKLDYLDENKATRLIDVTGNTLFLSDPYRVGVIINNLLSNALIFRVKDRLPIVGIEVTVNEKEALLVVKDNGPGIEPEVFPRIFDMFYRGHELSKGAGLGLYIVKEMTDKLGGRIEVHSQPNEGTTVTIHFPVL